MTRYIRPALLPLVLLGTLAALLVGEPIAQSPTYHAFADDRPLLGIPNFGDVVSNVPFLLVGVWAIARSKRWNAPHTRASWLVLFVGVTLVSLGSIGYHLAPSNATLVWDRLPMTVGFMGLFVALLAENLDRRMQRWALVPALLLGAGSVAYWALTDDLRWYYWVQGAPLLTIPLVLVLFPAPFGGARYLVLALACYFVAKVFEGFDAQVFELTQGTLSGHTLKHLSAALAPLSLHLMLVRRRHSSGMGR